jgi:selenocysteine lyase/cysteine desulfurase
MFDFSDTALDAEFPVRKRFVYFNHAAQAPLPRRVAAAIAAHLENVRDRGAADWRAWYDAIEKTREKVGRFLGATGPEIAFVPSTSWGTNLVAQSYDWKPGDSVVGDDMEFPTNHYPWKLLARRGVEYRIAANRGGRISAEDIASKIDGSTRVVAVSWVAFHNGWVYPLDEIGRLCRERGILLVVDAIQGLGALPIDVSKTPVDVLIADPHKWLLGPEAAAIFYVAESAREKLPPPFLGWWNLKSRGEFLDYSGEFVDSARRFEPGSLPAAQIAGLSASLDLLMEVGLETVRDRIMVVVRKLKSGLEQRSWRVTTPEPPSSGILAGVPPGASAWAMARSLEQRGILVTAREKAVRFSPHFFNDEREVERVLEAIDAQGASTAGMG